MKSKVLAALLCMTMTASCGVAAAAADGTDQTAAAAAAASGFSDVASDSWYAAAVKYVNDKGLFSGTSADSFSPGINMSRGMFVTVLGRAAGAAPTDTASGFSDVSPDKYYAPYIKWASDNNIVTGTGAGKFSPDADVSREQMCSILVRFLRDYKKLDLSAYTAESAIFADAAGISSWAVSDVIIAQRLGLIEGKVVSGDSLMFDPSGKTTRAAAAAVFQRLDTVLGELGAGKTDNSDTSSGSAQTGDSTSSGGSGSSSGGGSSGGGTSGGSSGGNTGGDTSGGGTGGDSTGGGSSGGDSSSGGNTGSDTGKGDSGTTDPTEPTDPSDPGDNDKKEYTDEEIQEESEIAGYLTNMSSKYKKSSYVTTVSKPVRQAMNLLIDTIDKVLADRAQGTFISSEYIRSHYSEDIEEFRSMYSAFNDDQNTEMENVAIRLETEAHIYVVMDYFGVKQADI